MKIGYIRVSTQDQNTAGQEEMLDVDEVYIDRMSGKTMERPELQKMMQGHDRKLFRGNMIYRLFVRTFILSETKNA